MTPMILGAVLLTVQTWSPAQQELVEIVRQCNDAWVASIAEGRFEVYDAACPATDEAVFWYTARSAPVAYKGAEGLWALSASENRAVSWRDLAPVTVQVDGDIAYIYYEVTWRIEPDAPAPRNSNVIRRAPEPQRHRRCGTATCGATPSRSRSSRR